MPRSIANLIAAVLVAISLLAPGPAAADAITYYVPTQFATIQAALNQADSILTQPTNTHTFTVLVEPGTYPGNITLKPNISLRGRETKRTILSGGGSGVIITAGQTAGASIRNFTFRNAGVGIVVNGPQAVLIESNVFSLGTSGTAIQVNDATNNSSITNNTFYQNLTAITRAANIVVIKNNIFSNNTTNIAPNFNAAEPNITYNDFHPDRGDTEPRGTFFLPTIAFPDPDPFFVDTAGFDLHLISTSPCINQGDPNIFDNFGSTTTDRSDMGAYGGAYTDTIPAQVTGMLASATTTTPYAINASWTASSNYAVAGYKVYYGYAPGSYTGNDAIVSGVTRTSPVDAGNVTSLALTGLVASSATPTAPVLMSPLTPRNGTLILEWSAVNGATGYRIHYGIASTSEQTTDVGNGTTYTLSGLTNGQTYLVQVSALAQATYYINVTAYDISTAAKAAGTSHESAYTGEIAVPVGSTSESPLSNEVSGTPEMITPYPDLPNSGCFIATAAYGSPFAPSVQVLREFRDRFLETNAPGRAFVRWYYANGPAAARYLNEHPALKPLAQAALAPFVAAALFFTRTAPLFQFAVLLSLALLAASLRRRSRVSTLSKETLR